MTEEEETLWRACAADLGLDYGPGEDYRHDVLSGAIDGARIKIIAGSPVTFEAPGLETRLGLGVKGAAAGVVLTGDADFDRDVVALGSQVVVFALLDEGTRGALGEFARAGELRMVDGRLSWVRNISVLPRQEDIERRVRSFTGVAKKLSSCGEDLFGRVEQRAMGDLTPGVRANALRCMAGRWGRELTARALTQAAADPDDVVRKMAQTLGAK